MTIPGQLPSQLPASKSGALDLASLRPGQSVNARVVGPAPGGATRLAIGASRIDVQLASTPQAGSIAQLRLEGTGPAARLVLTGFIAPPQSGRSPGNTAAANPVANAVAQMVTTALGRQDSAGALLANLQQLTGAGTPLPEPVVNAARQLLASRLDLSGQQLNGQALANAIARSGVFYEALLATGAPAGAPTGAPAGALQGDFKGLLLLLRSVLTGWPGGSPAKPGPTERPPPPTRRAPPRALAGGAGGQGAPGTSANAGISALMAQTEAALARLRLAQVASLPEARTTKSGEPAAAAKSEWTVEIPVFLGQQSTMLNLRITRDGGAAAPARQRGWRIQFALALDDLGEVGGQVAARAGAISVDLWAREAATRHWLLDRLGELAKSFEARGIRAAAIRCRAGPPADIAHRSGQFVDARS